MRPPRQDRCLERLAQAAVLLEDGPVVAHREDLSRDAIVSVSDDSGRTDSGFSGTVDWVQLDIDDAAEDVDHLIGPEERLRIAMARQ